MQEQRKDHLPEGPKGEISSGLGKKEYNAVLRVENTPEGRLVKNFTKVASTANFCEPRAADFCSRDDYVVCSTSVKPTKGTCCREAAAY